MKSASKISLTTRKDFFINYLFQKKNFRILNLKNQRDFQKKIHKKKIKRSSRMVNLIFGSDFKSTFRFLILFRKPRKNRFLRQNRPKLKTEKRPASWGIEEASWIHRENTADPPRKHREYTADTSRIHRGNIADPSRLHRKYIAETSGY